MLQTLTYGARRRTEQSQTNEWVLGNYIVQWGTSVQPIGLQQAGQEPSYRKQIAR